MLGPKRYAIAVRKPDSEIDIKVEEFNSLKNKNKLFKAPFIRGMIGLFESMKLGISALNHSAGIAGEVEDEEPTGFDKWLIDKFGSEKIERFIMTCATVLGTIIPIVLFIFLPTLLAGSLDRLAGSGIVRNLIEGLFRIIIFIIFMCSVSQMKDLKRVFAYHGAEHKTIFCYESGKELSVENVREYAKEHPRCGTSFLFSVMIISVLVFSVISWSNPYIRILLRLILLPVVVGISYEANRLIGRFDNPFTRFLRAPGVWFQKLTTNEPDDSMIEIAIAALKPVIPESPGTDEW